MTNGQVRNLVELRSFSELVGSLQDGIGDVVTREWWHYLNWRR
jgi:hypothetical protein